MPSWLGEDPAVGSGLSWYQPDRPKEAGCDRFCPSMAAGLFVYFVSVVNKVLMAIWCSLFCG
jgi:hypothetical protein